MIILSLCTFIYRRRYLLAATAPPSITISCFIDGSIVLENVAPLRNIQRKTINTGVIYIGSTKKRFALCLRNKSATHVTSQLPDGSTTEAPPLREEFAGLSFTNVLGICDLKKKTCNSI
jgi:hypothetical protein